MSDRKKKGAPLSNFSDLLVSMIFLQFILQHDAVVLEAVGDLQTAQ